jgi:ABC-type antimicrobial peptide transport system permease subunit
VLSFTVARRTREIGVRIALGASRQRVVAATFRRPLLQVALGIVVGTGIVFTAATTSPHGTSNVPGVSQPKVSALRKGLHTHPEPNRSQM